MSPEERVSLVETTTIERIEKRVEVVVATTEKEKDLSEKQEVVLPQAVREIDDDWFVLLDVAARESSFVPPGIVRFPYSLYKLILQFLMSHNTLFCLS